LTFSFIRVTLYMKLNLVMQIITQMIFIVKMKHKKLLDVEEGKHEVQ
jgi:hypothetical protein